MKPFLPLLACLAAAVPALALDLTPRFVNRRVNGRPQAIPTFADGETRYTVTLPRGVTAAAASQGETAFYLHDTADASIILKSSPFTPPPPFEEAALASYRKHAMETVPAGATEAELKEETANPLPFSDWSSRRYTLAYKLPGRSFTQTVTFVTVAPGKQILAITAAPSAKFEQAATVTWQLLRSWRVLPANEDLSVPPAL